MILQTLAFYLFAAVLLASAVMVISARNPVHSVLFLILSFFNAAALFVLIGAEFLAMILVVVYVGAVAVLFLFVVMMLDINLTELRQGFLQYLPIGALVGLVLLLELLVVAGGWSFGPELFRGGPVAHSRHRRTQQHGGAGRCALHALCVPLPGGGDHSPDRHDRRDRPHPAPPRHQAAAHRRPDRPPARGRDRGPQGPFGRRRLTWRSASRTT